MNLITIAQEINEIKKNSQKLNIGLYSIRNKEEESNKIRNKFLKGQNSLYDDYLILVGLILIIYVFSVIIGYLNNIYDIFCILFVSIILFYHLYKNKKKFTVSNDVFMQYSLFSLYKDTINAITENLNVIIQKTEKLVQTSDIVSIKYNIANKIRLLNFILNLNFPNEKIDEFIIKEYEFNLTNNISFFLLEDISENISKFKRIDINLLLLYYGFFFNDYSIIEAIWDEVRRDTNILTDFCNKLIAINYIQEIKNISNFVEYLKAKPKFEIDHLNDQANFHNKISEEIRICQEIINLEWDQNFNVIKSIDFNFYEFLKSNIIQSNIRHFYILNKVLEDEDISYALFRHLLKNNNIDSIDFYIFTENSIELLYLQMISSNDNKIYKPLIDVYKEWLDNRGKYSEFSEFIQFREAFRDGKLISD